MEGSLSVRSVGGIYMTIFRTAVLGKTNEGEGFTTTRGRFTAGSGSLQGGTWVCVYTSVLVPFFNGGLTFVGTSVWGFRARSVFLNVYVFDWFFWHFGVFYRVGARLHFIGTSIARYSC